MIQLRLKQNKTEKQIIPVFFAVDNNYIPLLKVALCSLKANGTKNCDYRIYVLSGDITEDNVNSVSKINDDNFTVEFVNVQDKLNAYDSVFAVRDYYSTTIYNRLFIQSMFPEYDKAVYLDCDIIVNEDIAKFYNIDLKNNYLGAVMEQVVNSVKEYRDYSSNVLGLEPRKYFNSGVLLMNLKKMREDRLDNFIFNLISYYRFDTIAPDQDYLNYATKGKVKHIELGWNKEPICDGYNKVPKLIHYAYFRKPWQKENIKFGKYFWEYAEKAGVSEYFKAKLAEYSEEDRKRDVEAHRNLIKRALKITKEQNTFEYALGKKQPARSFIEDMLGEFLPIAGVKA